MNIFTIITNFKPLTITAATIDTLEKWIQRIKANGYKIIKIIKIN